MSILGDTAELAILLKLKDEVTGPLKSIDSQLGGLNTKSATVAGGLSKIGQGLATGLKTTAVLATAAIGVLAGLEGKGLQSLEQQQTLEAQTAAAIKSTGAAAGVSATQVAAWARSLGDANAVDELAVQHVENLLLTFRHIQNDTFPQATQAVLDMSQALGTDAASSAIQLGKALDNPTLGLTALRRVGVSFSDVQVAQIKGFMKTNDVLSAQNIILAEINKEFGGSGSAFSQTTAGKIALVRDRFDELTRTLAQASLPAVTALADGLNELMASPEVIAGAQALGQAIAGIFSPSNIHAGLDFVKSILPPLESGLKLTVQAAKTAFDLFNALPPELKTVAIAALVGNKLTGGLVASGIGDVAKALMGGALGGGGLLGRGSTPANPLFVSDISGGGAGLGTIAKTEGGILSTLKTGLAVTIAAASIYELAQQIGTFMGQVGQAQSELQKQVNSTAQQTPQQAAANLEATVNGLNSMNIFQRAIALTGGGGQITQDFITAANHLTSATQTSADATKELPSAQKALDLAQYEHLTAAIGPLQDAISHLKDEIAANTQLVSVADNNAPIQLHAVAESAKAQAGAELVHRMGERGDVNTPLFEGILQRASNKGLAPGVSAIQSTYQRNIQRRLDMQAAAERTFRSEERGDLGKIRDAVNGVITAVNRKQFTVQQITNAYNTYRQGERDPGAPTTTSDVHDSRPPIQVSVKVDTRSTTTASTVANRYGRTPAGVGAQ